MLESGIGDKTDFLCVLPPQSKPDCQGIAWDHLSGSGKHAVNLAFTNQNNQNDLDDVRYGTRQFLYIDTGRQIARTQWNVDLSESHALMAGS